MWYSFIDGRVLLMFIIIGALWVNYWVSDEYIERKKTKERERANRKAGV